MANSEIPDLRLFVAEDLSKPENRANVWLIAAMGVETFWAAFSEEIGLSPECVMEPRQWPGRRPDLTVFLDAKPIAIIECENFSANKCQNEAYEAHCHERSATFVNFRSNLSSQKTERNLCGEALDCVRARPHARKVQSAANLP